MHVYIHVYTHVHTHFYTHVYIHVYTHVHTHVYAHVYTHVCTLGHVEYGAGGHLGLHCTAEETLRLAQSLHIFICIDTSVDMYIDMCARIAHVYRHATHARHGMHRTCTIRTLHMNQPCTMHHTYAHHTRTIRAYNMRGPAV